MATVQSVLDKACNNMLMAFSNLTAAYNGKLAVLNL